MISCEHEHVVRCCLSVVKDFKIQHIDNMQSKLSIEIFTITMANFTVVDVDKTLFNLSFR